MRKLDFEFTPEPMYFDHAVERALLGRILMPRNADPLDLDGLRPFHFHEGRHRIIFRAIQELQRTGQPVGPLTLKHHLSATGSLTMAGGAAYLGELLDDPATHPVWCRTKLRQLAAHRSLVRIAKRLSEGKAHDEDAQDRGRLTILSRMLISAVSEFDGIGAGNGERLRSLDLTTILTQPMESIPWAIPSWLARRDVVCIAGEPKLGKSWVALDLAIALTAGGSFLGALRVEGGPYRVLYVDEENNPRLVRYRIRKLANGLGLTSEHFASLQLRYLSENALNLDDDRELHALQREVSEFKPDWIILDSLIRFHRRDENSNAAMSEFHSRVIKTLTASSGAGIVLLHHLAKPDRSRADDFGHRVRGASDILASVDSLWGLSRSKDGGLTLRHERSRWAETALPMTFVLEDVNLGEGVRLVPQDTDSTPEALIIDLLRRGSDSGVARPEVLKVLKDSGSRSEDRLATKYLARFHERSTIRKRKEGRTARYWLAEFAPEDTE